MLFFFFSSRRRHTRWTGDWSSDVCSSDLGHEGCGIDLQGSLPRGFEAISGPDERQIGSLPNGENYGIARDNCLRSGSEGGAEPPLRVEYRRALDHFEARYLAILANELLRAERGMNPDPLDQALFNFFFRSGHFLARLEAHEVHFTSAHAQCLT